MTAGPMPEHHEEKPLPRAIRGAAATIQKRVLRLDRALVRAKRRGDEREVNRIGRMIHSLMQKLERLEARAERAGGGE